MDTDVAYAQYKIPGESLPRQAIARPPCEARDNQNDPQYHKQSCHKPLPPRKRSDSVARGTALAPIIIEFGDHPGKPVILVEATVVNP